MSIKMSFHAIVQLKFHSRQLELCSLASFTEACANCRTSYPNYVGLTNKHLTFYGAFHNVALICQRYFQTSQIFNEIKSNISTIQFSTQWKWVRQGPWNTEICSSVSTAASVLKVTVYPLENKFVWKKQDDNYWCRVTLKFESDRPDLYLDLDCLAPSTADSWEFADSFTDYQKKTRQNK